MKRFHFVIFLLFLFSFVGCNTIDVYEKTASLPHNKWSSNNLLSFTFTATDSLSYYNIYFVMRHSESYHFNNIWVDVTVTAPNKKTQTQRLNIQLANANGWLGTAMDDIIEQRVLMFRNPTRFLKGNYIFTLREVMREDPLQNVMNAGVRVEKVVQ